jgi:hypothetical protein
MDVGEANLPFSDIKQKAILGLLLNNERFFRSVYSKVKPSWFLSAKCGELYGLLLQYFEEYKMFPSNRALLSFKNLERLDLRKSNELKALFTVCTGATREFRKEELQKDLGEWFEATVLVEAMNKATGYYNRQELKQAHAILTAAIREINAGHFKDKKELRFDDFDTYMKEFDSQKDGALTTGLPILDRAVLSGATSGCLLPGDTTVIVAAVNSGKSIWQQTVALHNIKRGKDVLYLIHEGNEDQIRMALIGGYINASLNQVASMRHNPEGRKILEEATKSLQQHLCFRPFHKANKLVVEEVAAYVETQQEMWKNEKGKGFDLLVDDYPQVLQTELAYKGTLQKRNSDELVYGTFVQLGLEHKFHVLCAIQSNREGSRVNKHQGGESRLLTVEDVNESFGPIQKANNVLVMSRSPMAERMGIAHLSIGKTRTNKKGYVVVYKTDYGKCISHSQDLGGMLYFGTNTIESKFEKYFAHYKNEEILENIATAF